jgi:hypothetical protein
MWRYRGLVAAVLWLSIGSCTSSQTPAPQQSAPAKLPPDLQAEYAAYAEPGTGSITGQAFLRTLGGEVRYGAGGTVTAEPATDWVIGLVERIGRLPPHEALKPYRRTTRADAEGRFSFTDLPEGRWLLATEITWYVPSTTAYGRPTKTGGLATAVVDLAEGEQKAGVVVTR